MAIVHPSASPINIQLYQLAPLISIRGFKKVAHVIQRTQISGVSAQA